MGTVVFVHGFPFDGSMWDAQLAALPTGWRGLAPHLRGFGDAPLEAVPGEVPTGADLGGDVAFPAEPVLPMELLADDIAGLIEREAGGRAVVCGLSMGGYVALSLWRRRPELVRALVLADTRAEPDTDEGRGNRARMAALARRSGAAAIASAMLPTVLSERTLGTRAGTADRVRDMMLGTAPATIVAALAGMAARRDSRPDLPTVDVPALVVVGEEDTLTPPDVARALADGLSRATLEVIPDAAHLSNLENPPAFDAALARFLTTL